MHPRNRFLSLLIAISCLAVSGLAQTPAGQSAPQNQGQPSAVQQSGDPMDEPLKPEELVVPSNAALTSVAPPAATVPAPSTGAPATTATATAPVPNTTAPAPNGGAIQQQGKSGIFTMRAEVDEVVLHATVVDEHQRLITNLGRNAFQVFENGQAQPITSFRHEDVPVAVGILVDNSGSMREKRAAVTQAALNFVRASNPDDRVFVVNFSDEPYIDADFTSSVPKLQAALENIDSRGETALYDAVVASADHLMKQPGIDKRLEKKVLLVVTDGWDNASTESLEQAIRRVQVDGGPTVYTIGILDEDSKKKGKRALKELAEQTGGVAFFPQDLAEVDAITQEVAHDIRNQYTIGYKKNPGSAPGYRSVKVVARASGYKDLQVRTRTGYFPGEEQAAKQ